MKITAETTAAVQKCLEELYPGQEIEINSLVLTPNGILVYANLLTTQDPLFRRRAFMSSIITPQSLERYL